MFKIHNRSKFNSQHDHMGGATIWPLDKHEIFHFDND